MDMLSILNDRFNVSAYIPFLKVPEEGIRKNMNALKQTAWFQEFLTDGKFYNLIINDDEIRQLIGRCNRTKLHKENYVKGFRRKLHKRLVKKTTSAET